jgi:hypothetical protein
MKAQYRFCGDFGVHGSLTFDHLGQEFEMESEEALDLARGGFPILPNEEFSALGFTPKELEEFPSAVSHEDAPKEFQEKKAAMLLALYEFRQSLIAA